MKYLTILLLLSVSPALAQETRHLQGEIHSETPMDYSWLAVKIEMPGSRESAEVSAVTPNGSFAFRNIAQGVYTLKVIDPDGNEITSQPLIVTSANPPIEVRLPTRKTDLPTGETTSLARLRHHPGKKALDAARQGQRFSEAGNYQRAATQYEQAIALDPDYSEALGNLGAQYVRLGRIREAADLFQRAIALDPVTSQHQSNLALALSQLGNLPEAENWARHAVAIDGSNALAHYVLGCVLTYRTTSLPEAIQQLQTASRAFPRAHEVLAQIYRTTGKLKESEEELREYHEVTAPAPANAPTHVSPQFIH